MSLGGDVGAEDRMDMIGGRPCFEVPASEPAERVCVSKGRRTRNRTHQSRVIQNSFSSGRSGPPVFTCAHTSPARIRVTPLP